MAAELTDEEDILKDAELRAGINGHGYIADNLRSAAWVCHCPLRTEAGADRESVERCVIPDRGYQMSS